MGFVLPQPTAEDIADFTRFFYDSYERKLAEEESRDALTHLITIAYHCTVIALTCSTTDSMPANPTTTVK